MGVHSSDYCAWRAEPFPERGKSDRRLVGLIKQSWLESGGVYGYANDVSPVQYEKQYFNRLESVY